MRDTLSIGPTPAAEDCEQLGPNYDPVKAKKECRAYINQLTRLYPHMKGRFRISNNPHDFGTYHEVEVLFDSDNEQSVNSAFEIDANIPEHWDEQAKIELGLNVTA